MNEFELKDNERKNVLFDICNDFYQTNMNLDREINELYDKIYHIPECFSKEELVSMILEKKQKERLFEDNKANFVTSIFDFMESISR